MFFFIIFIFLIIHIVDLIISEYSDGVSLIPPIFWAFVNYWILSFGNKKYHSIIKEDNDSAITAGNSTYSYANPEGASKDTVIKPDALHTQSNMQCNFVDNTKPIVSRKNAELESEYKNYYNYESISTFYLYHSALIVDGDNSYYHRVDCPTLEDDYTYVIYTNRGAEAEGYTACPVCYQCPVETYVEKF